MAFSFSSGFTKYTVYYITQYIHVVMVGFQNKCCSLAELKTSQISCIYLWHYSWRTSVYHVFLWVCFRLRCSLFCCQPLFTLQVKPERSFRSRSAELYNPLLSSPLWIKSSESSLGRLSCLDGSCHWDPWDCTWLSARDDATTSLWYSVLPQSSETFSLGGNAGRNTIRSQRDSYTRSKALITHKQHHPPPPPTPKKS